MGEEGALRLGVVLEKDTVKQKYSSFLLFLSLSFHVETHHIGSQ